MTILPSLQSCAVSQQGEFSLLIPKDYFVREINALLWFFLIAITSLLVRKIVLLIRFWAKARRIPGPPCPSFYGHSKLIAGAGSGHNLTDFLSKSHEKYGSIVRLWLGPTQLLVSVKDPTRIKDMLIKAEDKLPLTGKAFRLAFGRSSLFDPSFEKVQKRRDSLAIELNGKLLERANEISLKVVDCVMERINSIMAKGILDCRSVSQHMAFSVLGATLFGDAFLAWPNAIDYEELLVKIAKDACFWASYNVPPFWKQEFWKYQGLCTRLKSLTQDIIQFCRQNYKLSGQIDITSQNKTGRIGSEIEVDTVFPRNDTMGDGLFSEELKGHLDPREEPCANIMGVMFHGCLTTAGLIGSILTRLVMHPEIQEKIYSEIIMVRKSSKPEAYDVQKMHFLLATIYESARLLPAGPLLQRCSLKHDLNLETGITVPAGAILVVPIQLVQMDCTSWGSDASEFNPYRFLSTATHQGHKAAEESNSVPITSLAGDVEEPADSGNSPFVVDDPNENAAFLPFGSGTRACVGQKFAIIGITTLFASLLQHYEVRLQPGSENNPKPMMNDCVFQLLPSPKIVFVKRNR
ncbi:uncharacterized protein LOC131250953 [Magnolia sinica]|uniref:uncharacterized protein LOC131250953 n=1 Tax=Magnolia sinica TaxID=86752 RepID=UPI00265B31D7|nr:uncharacterized protein LOC131250953 [Magnolia sinica]